MEGQHLNTTTHTGPTLWQDPAATAYAAELGGLRGHGTRRGVHQAAAQSAVGPGAWYREIHFGSVSRDPSTCGDRPAARGPGDSLCAGVCGGRAAGEQ